MDGGDESHRTRPCVALFFQGWWFSAEGAWLSPVPSDRHIPSQASFVVPLALIMCPPSREDHSLCSVTSVGTAWSPGTFSKEK